MGFIGIYYDMISVPSYLYGAQQVQVKRRGAPYISPCRIVSWAFLYFFVFALHFTAIFFAGRNFQRHDKRGPQKGFGNRTDFVNLFIFLSIPFMFFSASFGHYYFPSLSYVIPLMLSFHLTLKKYDGRTDKSIFILWIPVHFCVLVVWYFHTLIIKEENNAKRRDFMKIRFIAFIIFYMGLLLEIDGYIDIPVTAFGIGLCLLDIFIRMNIFYNASIFPFFLIIGLEILQILLFSLRLDHFITLHFHILMIPSYILLVLDAVGKSLHIGHVARHGFSN